MTASATKPNPSAIDSLGEAISHMRAKLFPFSFLGWLTLAFVSLIESCGSSGGGPGMPGTGNPVGGKFGGPSSMEDPARLIEEVSAWIMAHMVLLVVGLLVVMVISLVIMWLRSRMIFVYIDDVATGRFDLVRPWKQHGALADSFFGLSLVVQGAMFILVVLILGLGALFVVWAGTRDLGMGVIAMGVLPLGFLFVLSIIAAAVMNMVLRDFVAPIQVSRDIGAREAGGIFVSMFSARPGLFVGYVLFRFVVGIAVGIGMAIIGCLTCCLGFLPLVNQMLFQPVYYTERAWSLKLLAQLGDDITHKVMPPPAPSHEGSSSDAPTGPIDLSAIDFDKPYPQG
ncbi:MAG: hypothetical protein ABI672_17715 [Vicinamibacteria bacterium]